MTFSRDPVSPYTPLSQPSPEDPLAPLRALAEDLAIASRAPNTRRAYGSQWRVFEAWARSQGMVALPASGETVALYLAHLASSGRKAGTIGSALVSISQVHLDQGFTSPRGDPLVRRVMKGIRRRWGAEPVPKQPVLREHLRSMLAPLANDLRGLRDRAILMFGFATGLRRSELVALDVEDLEQVSEGLILRVRRSKTDPNGDGRKLGVRFGEDNAACPVHTLRRWLEAAAITQGPLFRPITRGNRCLPRRLDGRTIARVVQSAARLACLDVRAYGAHSLRSGCATAATLSGKDEGDIARLLGHRSRQMAARYIRVAPTF
jgi:integrase